MLQNTFWDFENKDENVLWGINIPQKVLHCQENDHCGIRYWLLKFDLIKLREEVKDGWEVPLLHKHIYNSSSYLFLFSLYSKLKIPKESVLFKKCNMVFMKDLVSKETV